MGIFYVDTSTGSVATAAQLRAAGVAEPVQPWLRINASDDVTTLWHSILVKEERGVFIATAALRHGNHHALLLQRGWRELDPTEIGTSLPGVDGPVELAPSPWADPTSLIKNPPPGV